MATNYTANYGLCQWEAEDNFLREEFNQDNAKIDAALKGLENTKANSSTTNSRLTALENRVEVIVGSYTGDGAATRTIDLGFTPKAVLLEHPSGMRMTNNNIAFGGLALLNFPANGFQIVEGGFSVRYNSGYVHTNNSGTVYHYLAFK